MSEKKTISFRANKETIELFNKISKLLNTKSCMRLNRSEVFAVLMHDALERPWSKTQIRKSI